MDMTKGNIPSRKLLPSFCDVHLQHNYYRMRIHPRTEEGSHLASYGSSDKYVPCFGRSESIPQHSALRVRLLLALLLRIFEQSEDPF